MFARKAEAYLREALLVGLYTIFTTLHFLRNFQMRQISYSVTLN